MPVALLVVGEFPDPSDLADLLGPQLPGEGVLSARVRLHQSWYRAAILGCPAWGSTPPPHHRPLGSILTETDATRGRAFTSEAARRLFLERRTQGWGVDPVRIQSHLTSSQGLTLNVLGPLRDSPSWSARVLSAVLELDVTAVHAIHVEYAPCKPSQFLGDKTRMDAFFVLDVEGQMRHVMLEMKLGDRWSSRRLNLKAARYSQAALTLGDWRTESDAFSTPSINQLVRCHMLASLVARRMGASDPVLAVVVALAADENSTAVSAIYRSVLRDDGLFRHVSLETLLANMQETARTHVERRAAKALHLRYVNFEASDFLMPPSHAYVDESTLQGVSS